MHASQDFGVRIEGHGTVAIIRPLTQAGLAWVEGHIYYEPWQTICGGIAAEPRSVQPIVDGIEQADLRVQA